MVLMRRDMSSFTKLGKKKGRLRVGTKDEGERRGEKVRIREEGVRGEGRGVRIREEGVRGEGRGVRV